MNADTHGYLVETWPGDGKPRRQERNNERRKKEGRRKRNANSLIRIHGSPCEREISIVMKSTEELVLEVRRMFRKSRPNGILLAWDRSRFLSCLVELCANCRVVNDTDFNYSFCNSFTIEPRDDLRECTYVITFKISFILDVYSLHVTRYSNDRKCGEVVSESECEDLSATIETLRGFAEEKGLQEIGSAEHGIVVDGVSLELSEVATLGKCLFDDFE